MITHAAFPKTNYTVLLDRPVRGGFLVYVHAGKRRVEAGKGFVDVEQRDKIVADKFTVECNVVSFQH